MFMKNIDIINKISQGMYVLTTQNGGCIVALKQFLNKNK